MSGQYLKPTVIWRLSDGRPGHDTQSKGLVNSLDRLTRCECYDINIITFSHKFLNLILGKFRPGDNLPDPDLIIGAGHATHLPILCAKYARGGKSVIIMKPSLPCSLFDYCIIPEHDNPPVRNNIIPVQGAINSIRSTSEHDATRGLILIGGPSRHHSWDPDSLINQIDEIVKNDPGIQWTITDSPRTPAGTLEILTNKQWQTVKYLPYSESNVSSLPGLYALCSIIWVSEDSISMICEALTSGARVGILSMPEKGISRVGSAVNKFVSTNKITSYKNWHETRKMNKPLDNFNESDRCAELIYMHALCK